MDKRTLQLGCRRFVVATLLALSLVLTSGAIPTTAQDDLNPGATQEEIETRDMLIVSQESLLNAYRCRFDIDTQIVPGGCESGKPHKRVPEPPRFEGFPTQRELQIRDDLIASQEALLNTYRCRFNIDTHIAPGRCIPPLVEVSSDLVWSPDGTRTAYARGYVEALYVADVLGNNPKQIASGFAYPNWVQNIAWSPDGTEIAFSHVHGHSYRGGIRVVPADGSGNPRWISDCGNRPSWSPDGSRIAFYFETTRGCNMVEGTYVVNADGTGFMKVSDYFELSGDTPDWTPDGRALRSPTRLYHINDDGTIDIEEMEYLRVPEGRPLPEGIDNGSEPVWSSDGTRVIFLSECTRELTPDGAISGQHCNKVFVANADGSDLKEVISIKDLPKTTDEYKNSFRNWYFDSESSPYPAPMQFIPGENIIVVTAASKMPRGPCGDGCYSHSNAYRTFLVTLPEQS